jgi:hypothetical protein
MNGDDDDDDNNIVRKRRNVLQRSISLVVNSVLIISNVLTAIATVRYPYLYIALCCYNVSFM